MSNQSNPPNEISRRHALKQAAAEAGADLVLRCEGRKQAVVDAGAAPLLVAMLSGSQPTGLGTEFSGFHGCER